MPDWRASEFEEADDPAKNPPLHQVRVLRARRVPPRWLHVADTQRVLAVIIVIATLALYGYLVVAMVYGWIGSEGFVRTIAALSPIQALAAATVGFFFGRRDSPEPPAYRKERE
jgi:hypothetical protein